MIKSFASFIKDLIKSRDLMKTLAINDIKMKYAGSMFGIIWAFIQPLMTILVMWLVFQQGFKNPPISNVPYILWLTAGYVPWFYFSDAVINSTSCLYDYSYLVKKVKFRTSVLPIVKVLSALIVHTFFIIFIIFLYLIHGQGFSLIYLQAIYYTLAMSFLLVGLAWLLSSLAVFFKDLTQIVTVFLQIGFWATPIIWDPENMSSKVVNILKLNPMFYIIQGYRNTFVLKIPFYMHPKQTVYFWIITTIILIVGATTYQKLRPHFADVL